MFNIVTLTFLACLAGGSPGTTRDCHKVTVPFEGTLGNCVMQGQTEVAKWFGQNPPRILAYGRDGGYRCSSEPSGLTEHDA